MFKDSNFDKIAEEMNHYARQAMETKPDPAWRETDSEEVKAFFALNILFGIKQLPEVYSYWSRNQLLGVPEVQKIFPRNRFAKISQYLHLNNKDGNCHVGTQTTTNCSKCNLFSILL